MTEKPSANYRVYRTISGKVRVKHACPHCKARIENEITEAGRSDKCPECGVVFVVPGESDRIKLEQKLLAEKEARTKAEELKRWQEAAEKAPPAPPSPARTAPPNPKTDVEYPALDFYAKLMNAFGWVTIVIGGMLIAAMLVLGAIRLYGGGDLEAVDIAGTAVVFATMFIALAFFVASELIRLAIDARRDIARIAEAAEGKQ